MKIHEPTTITTSCEATRVRVAGAKLIKLDYAARVLIVRDQHGFTYEKTGAEFDKVTRLAENHARDIDADVHQ